MAGLEKNYKPKRVSHTPSLLQIDASGGIRVAKYNTRSNKRDLQGGKGQKKPRARKKLPTVLVHPLQGGRKINSERMASTNLSDDGEQQCCLNLQSTIQVLQEALNANTFQLADFKLEAHRELKTVKKEKGRVITELNKIKAENSELNKIKAAKSESTSGINGIMKSVAGLFRG
ncbi:hypothetical protein V490_00074 [Pseudogymnoascus sp. VKM F-3557]|nr:hypothetical protein V490_00074 [Pseudogymnoascus sp. VKM F-3557]